MSRTFWYPYHSLHEKSHCRFLHNGSKVIFYSLLITGKLVPKLKVSILYKLDKSSEWLLSHNFKSPSFRLKCERKLKFLPYREWNCSYCFRDFKSCSIPSVDLDSSLNAAVIRCEIKVSISIINKASFYFTQPIDRNDRLIFSLPALLSD